MIFYIVYIASIIVLALHFTGFLARRNMEWGCAGGCGGTVRGQYS